VVQKGCHPLFSFLGILKTGWFSPFLFHLARETGWGYRRIIGELKKLRIHSVSRSTIKNILQEEGIKPSPKRGSGTWDERLLSSE